MFEVVAEESLRAALTHIPCKSCMRSSLLFSKSGLGGCCFVEDEDSAQTETSRSLSVWLLYTVYDRGVLGDAGYHRKPVLLEMHNFN